ncbi:MAG: hypothetical protein VX366_00135 [Candidatus Thermoplasmatota archaeon]|nr:hypothetical protein [Candidatus Thermoplasmatota archaeon]
MGKQPLLTMTKSRIIAQQPDLDPQSSGLLDTLCTLCSFYTCEDLASFLFSDIFRNLVTTDEPWIIFEIGIYAEHTKTVELIPVYDGITIADGSMTGGIPNHVIVIKSEQDCSDTLATWYNHVMNA